jgi:triosephosphate isomerase
MLILNLKNYAESTGKNLPAVLDALKAAQAAEPRLKDILFVAPALYDLHFALANYPELNIISQHVTANPVGSTTGRIPAESLLALGLTHSVINHSEHRFDFSRLLTEVEKINAVGMKLVVCCESLEEAEQLMAKSPMAIAFEDKDLIGTGNSITTGRPDDVKAFVQMMGDKVLPIIGAGVSTAEDVAAGLEMGAKGFILASAFVKAADRQQKVLELAAPFWQTKNS